MTNKISQEVLKELLAYDENAGHLLWKPRDEKWFKDKWSFLVWNKKYSDKFFGTKDKEGYIIGTILYNRYREHSLVWLYHHSEYPSQFIDHINGDRSDNRLLNLRQVNRTLSARNLSIRADNKSGYHGVYWSNTNKKWVAQIGIGGVNKYLGGYDTPEEAFLARNPYLEEFEYHENHGRR